MLAIEWWPFSSPPLSFGASQGHSQLPSSIIASAGLAANYLRCPTSIGSVSSFRRNLARRDATFRKPRSWLARDQSNAGYATMHRSWAHLHRRCQLPIILPLIARGSRSHADLRTLFFLCILRLFLSISLRERRARNWLEATRILPTAILFFCSLLRYVTRFLLSPKLYWVAC